MNSKIPFHHNASRGTQEFAKELRQRQTSAEELFWKMVRNRRMLGLKIRRQHPIGKYIVDFYCHELKLVIELDGSIHNLEHVRKKDKIRDAFLKEQGLRIFRVDNVFVFSNPHLIEEQIALIKQNNV
jgi:very-short-patch-repair endonuclease